MRRRSIVVAMAAVAALVFAGCGGSSSNDPYGIVRRAQDARWDQVQIEIGASVKSGPTTVSLDPGALRLVLDQVKGKGNFHLALPTAMFGSSAAGLAQLGVTGETLDFDAVYDGQALYAKSPLFAPIVTFLLAGTGSTPSGNLTGWLRLATKGDFDALMAGATTASPEPTAGDTAALKQQLNDAGVTLAYVDTEKRGGVDANHVTATIDMNKLLDNKAFDSMNRTQLNQVRDFSKSGSVSLDFWTDAGSGQFIELDIHVVSTGATAGSADIAVKLSAPAGGATFDAPANAVDVPARTLIGAALKIAGQSFLNP